MTDEEINRKFDIVAGHLATLAVAQQKSEERWERTENSIRGLLTITQIQSEEIRVQSEGIKALGDAVRAVNQRQQDTDERQRQNEELRREMDERLNALINTVERYISERRNGRSEQS
jgi:hypothetical protein